MTMGQYRRPEQRLPGAPGWQGTARIAGVPTPLPGNIASSVKLGAIPAVLDPRALRLEDFVTVGPYPDLFSNSRTVAQWNMLANDQKGCCVVSGYGHKAMLESTQSGNPTDMTDAEVLAVYNQLTGGIDRGLVIQEFLKWARKNLFEGQRLLGYAYVDPKNTPLTKWALSTFGSLMRGLLLPDTAAPQSGTGGLWTPVNPGSPDAVPGSWGGHLTLDTGYSQSFVETITWGYIQKAAWEFYTKYSMECWALIPLWPVPGFDQAKFIQALKDLGVDVDFDPLPPPPPAPFDITKVSDAAFMDEFVRRYGRIAYIDHDIVFEKGQHWPWRGYAP